MTNISGEAYQEELSISDPEAEKVSQDLGLILGSFNNSDISYETLKEISDKIQNRIDELKINLLPAIETEIFEVERYIEQRRLEYEKAKNASVFIDHFSEEVEFHYSDQKARFIEEHIRELLEKKYEREKEKYKVLQDLEFIEARKIVSSKLLESYSLRDEVYQIGDYSQEVASEIYFDLENYDSLTSATNESIDNWERSWVTLIRILGQTNSLQNKIEELFNYFEGIKGQLLEKDPEKRFVEDEITRYPDLEPILQEVYSDNSTSLISSLNALYELSVNYQVNEDYLPEYRQTAVGRINRLKSIIISIRTLFDSYKLENRDFKKSVNNIFVLLNKALQLIEAQQKLLKNQQELKIRKIKDLLSLILKNSPENLRRSMEEIHTLINKLYNFGAANNQVEALFYFYNLRAREPVDEERRDDLIYGLNEERDSMNIREIDQMCQALGIKYDQKRGFFKDEPVQQTIQPPKKEIAKPLIPEPEPLPPKKSKAGNLEFLGQMYLKEAQRSKGEWAAKSYIKAIEAFIKCAEVEDELVHKLSFFKLAFKAAKDAVTEKEQGITLYFYALTYRELAYHHNQNLTVPAYLKIGDNFITAGKMYIREENISEAHKSFSAAKKVFEQSPDDYQINERINSLKNFLQDD